MSATTERLGQQHLALVEANRARLAAVDVKREIRVGALSVAQALKDPRSASLPVSQLLLAQPRWGHVRMRRALGMLHGLHTCLISENRRVRELTDRQRVLLGEIVREV